MKTRFYKILYKNKDVVYVGVTTRTINERFREHLFSKSLNPIDFTIVEFDCIEHPEIDSIEVFYKERIKVVKFEQKYIKEEWNKGSKLLNISAGGEWGAQIIKKLREEEFFDKFGSYDGYKKYVEKRSKVRIWLHSWIQNRSKSKLKKWVQYWIRHRGSNKTGVWIRNWVSCKTRNKTKTWFRVWVHHRTVCKTKTWIKHWVEYRNHKILKEWLRGWIHNKGTPKSKKWLFRWVNNKITSKTKKWLQRWKVNLSANKFKRWTQSWVLHRK